MPRLCVPGRLAWISGEPRQRAPKAQGFCERVPASGSRHAEEGWGLGGEDACIVPRYAVIMYLPDLGLPT